MFAHRDWFTDGSVTQSVRETLGNLYWSFWGKIESLLLLWEAPKEIFFLCCWLFQNLSLAASHVAGTREDLAKVRPIQKKQD